MAKKSSFTRFPQMKGKPIEAIEVDGNAEGIFMVFSDNTGLYFDIDSSSAVSAKKILDSWGTRYAVYAQ